MATVFAVSSSIPQIIKSIKSKKTDDVSIWLVIVLIIGLSLWVVYGIGINDLVILIANSIAVAINIILLILIKIRRGVFSIISVFVLISKKA